MLTGTKDPFTPGCESKGEVNAFGTLGVADAKYLLCVLMPKEFERLVHKPKIRMII